MKNERMNKLNNANVDTSKFFNVNVNVPVGADLKIMIDGVPYDITSDMIAGNIMDAGYVFNRKVDGRFVTAQTFHMLNDRTYNYDKGCYETGWDAYLRNRYSYYYQFEMLADELHRLARMERERDEAFAKYKQFFTKEVVIALCEDHILRAHKYIDNLPVRHYQGKPYKRIRWYGDVLTEDIHKNVFKVLMAHRDMVAISNNYRELEASFKGFKRHLVGVGEDTPKCKEWKDAFKGKGAYVTLLNIIKWHGCRVHLMNTKESVVFVENLLDAYKNEPWRFHYLLKEVIKENDFNLAESIERQKVIK